MDRRMADFLAGVTNVVKFEAVLSREVAPNGAQYMHLQAEETPLLEFWHSLEAAAKKDAPPKHTGGKKPYLMLMLGELTALRDEKIPNFEELIGFLVLLGRNIEWGTGRLVKERSKRSLKYADLREMFSYGNKRLNRILADLKVHDLLYGTQDGYFVSSRLIRKGKTTKQEG